MECWKETCTLLSRQSQFLIFIGLTTWLNHRNKKKLHPTWTCDFEVNITDKLTTDAMVPPICTLDGLWQKRVYADSDGQSTVPFI